MAIKANPIRIEEISRKAGAVIWIDRTQRPQSLALRNMQSTSRPNPTPSNADVSKQSSNSKGSSMGNLILWLGGRRIRRCSLFWRRSCSRERPFCAGLRPKHTEVLGVPTSPKQGTPSDSSSTKPKDQRSPYSKTLRTILRVDRTSRIRNAGSRHSDSPSDRSCSDSPRWLSSGLQIRLARHDANHRKGIRNPGNRRQEGTA